MILIKNINIGEVTMIQIKKKIWVEKTQTDMFSRLKGEFCANIPRNFETLRGPRDNAGDLNLYLSDK